MSRIGILALTALLWGACVQVNPPRQPNVQQTAQLTVDYVCAPVEGRGELELQDLQGQREAAAYLRRAWIHLERKEWDATKDACAQVLYGPNDNASTRAKAFARYIRAETFNRQGEPELGAYDRKLAAELALDPRLRQRIAASGTVNKRTARKPAPAARLAVQKRSSWRPDPAIPARLDKMGRPYRLTVHHSAILFRGTQPQATAAQLRIIQRNHMQNPGRRYGDIGYHFLIDPAGRVWEGRQLRWQGAHARNDNNRGNIGICILGNFVGGKNGQRPNKAQQQALRQLVLDLSKRYRIADNQIFGHSDFVATQCPGPYWQPMVKQLRKEVRLANTRRQRQGNAAMATND